MTNILNQIDKVATTIGLVDGDVKSVELDVREAKALASVLSNCYMTPVREKGYTVRTGIFESGISVIFATERKSGINFKLKAVDLGF